MYLPAVYCNNKKTPKANPAFWGFYKTAVLAAQQAL